MITISFDRFDKADTPFLLDLGLMDDVILHEMGHIIGLGTVWDYDHDLLDENNDYKVDTMATTVWQNEWDCIGTPPIEKDYGEGTAFGHWDEECLLDELMTGFISLEVTPLSRLTIACFDDLGYTVDYDTADDFDGSNTACCKAGVIAASPNQNKLILSKTGRDAAVAYGKKILRERQLLDDAAHLLENYHSTGVQYVGDKIVTVLYREGYNIFSVIVTNNNG